MIREIKIESSELEEQWHRMNRWLSSGSSDVKTANSKVFARTPSAPDELTLRPVEASDDLCQRSCAVECNG
jgi:hypothetical protein